MRIKFSVQYCAFFLPIYLSIIENLGLTEEAYIVIGPELEKFYENELTRHNLLSQICANFRENNLLLAQSWDSKKEPKP